MKRSTWIIALPVLFWLAPTLAEPPRELGGEPVLLAQAGESPEQAGETREQAHHQPGNWVKGGDPVMTVPGMPLACRQQYFCSPPQAMIQSDASRVKTTPPEWVNGACSVAGGPADECNVCLSNPPETPCEWWFEESE